MTLVNTQKVHSSSKEHDRIAGVRMLVIILKTAGLLHWQAIEDQTWFTKLLNFIHVCVVHLPISCAFCILMWVEVFRAPDLVEAGDVLYMTLTLTIVTPKLVKCWLISTKLSTFIRHFETSPLYELNTQEEIDVWSHHQKIFRRVALIYFGSGVFSGAAAFVTVLFVDDYQLGFPYWVPFEWQSPQRYWYAYAYNVIGIYTACLTNIGYDMLNCYLLFHIGLLYKLLSIRLKQLQHVGDKNAMEKLMEFLQMDINIKRDTKECESLVSFYVLSQIIFSAVIICFCGYRMLKMNIMQNLGKFLAMFQFLSAIVLEIFIPCYFANEVTVNASQLIFDIYNSNWLEYNVRTRKFINLYMEFLKQPVIIRAGGYFEIGLPIFTNVMNNAYRLFALLLNIET